MKYSAILATAILALGTAASASTLSGDSVTREVTNNGSIIVPVTSFTVGAGVDFTDANINIDMNAGAMGDQLEITVAPGNYGGMYSTSGTTVLTFGDLDFTDGSSLIGFDVIDDGPLDFVASIVDGSTLALTFDEAPITGGTFALGTYVTDIVTAPVPLPAGGLLLLTGLGAFAVSRRKSAA
ncbi:VPLPA-CTERM sorting domain-containing protein [Primorskyibacter sp. S187A]|uniref:VPLPA-CTERM sorting domain-containing protein n=1 Tax=Primorskyibacter sp. S187A TaxID=3415130 RepID=UPI003C7D15E3